MAELRNYRSPMKSMWLSVTCLLLIFAQMSHERPKSSVVSYDWYSVAENLTDFDDRNASFGNESVIYYDYTDQKSLLDLSATDRVNCLNGSSKVCCAKPFIPIPNRGDPHCCKPNEQTTLPNCCPVPLIPSREPNVDQAIGPFCCDASTGHCCLQDIARRQVPRPIKGRCCISTSCCPPPLFPRNLGSLCCSHSEDDSDRYCCPLRWIFNWPTPRCCSPRGFCCPLPYNVRYEYGILDDDKCHSPGASCDLPKIPDYKSCILQPRLPLPINGRDTPEYDLSYPKFSSPDRNKTVTFAYPQCTRAEVIREVFGNEYYVKSLQASSVPINWIVTRTKTQRMKLVLTNDIELNERYFSWPEVIIPFLFPLSMAVTSIFSIIPLILLSAVGFAVLYNCRFLAHKRIRMVMRKLLIYLEKRQRNFQRRSLPPQHLKKVRRHDRYQMPKGFQDSDLSNDDEPEELETDEELYANGNPETLWTQEEIDRLGYDPDHIPLEWIYGDLLGKPDMLRPEVKTFNLRQKRTRDAEPASRIDVGGLNSEDWHDFVSIRARENVNKEEGNMSHNIMDIMRQVRRNPSRSQSASDTLLKTKKEKAKGIKITGNQRP